jgi:hypothetical protein
MWTELPKSDVPSTRVIETLACPGATADAIGCGVDCVTQPAQPTATETSNAPTPQRMIGA